VYTTNALANVRRDRPAFGPTRVCALMALSLVCLMGCGGATVAVPTEFPVPLVERVPVTMGVHLSPELRKFVHREKLQNSGEWSIDLGDAQEPMFTNLIGGMFADMRFINDTDAPAAAVDAILVPSISEVQFSIPTQTRSDYFEVWIRYHFQLLGNDGQAFAEWDLTAYGKANQRNYGGLQGSQPALQAAALSACRDAMAFFTVQFGGVPPVKNWLISLRGQPEGQPT
jgi:hypothetical protein